MKQNRRYRNPTTITFYQTWSKNHVNFKTKSYFKHCITLIQFIIFFKSWKSYLKIDHFTIPHRFPEVFFANRAGALNQWYSYRQTQSSVWFHCGCIWTVSGRYLHSCSFSYQAVKSTTKRNNEIKIWYLKIETRQIRHWHNFKNLYQN